jgi:hypothetical protein
VPNVVMVLSLESYGDLESAMKGVGAPTDVVEKIAGRPPEDFASIAQRYARASPQAIRGLSGALREVSGVLAAVLARKPDRPDRSAPRRAAR